MTREENMHVVRETLKAMLNLREEVKKFRNYAGMNAGVIDKAEQRLKCIDITLETLEVEIARVSQVEERMVREGVEMQKNLDKIVIESLKSAGIKEEGCGQHQYELGRCIGCGKNQEEDWSRG